MIELEDREMYVQRSQSETAWLFRETQTTNMLGDAHYLGDDYIFCDAQSCVIRIVHGRGGNPRRQLQPRTLSPAKP
jgi:hypothetical protein